MNSEARRLIEANVKTRFDLERDAVLRPLLLQLGDEDYVFAVIVHHIAIDGWSFRLFIDEIASCYSAFLEGRTLDCPASRFNMPTSPIGNVVGWLATSLAGHLDYWRERLGKNPPILSLPLDLCRDRSRTFNSSVFRVTINSGRSKRLKEISRRAGATLFTVLLAGVRDGVDAIFGAGRLHPRLRSCRLGSAPKSKTCWVFSATYWLSAWICREIQHSPNWFSARARSSLRLTNMERIRSSGWSKLIQPKRPRPAIRSCKSPEHAEFVGPGRSVLARTFRSAR